MTATAKRLQVGIDFSQKRADLCLLFPDGQPLESHRAFANSRPGFMDAKQLLLEMLDTHHDPVHSHLPRCGSTR